MGDRYPDRLRLAALLFGVSLLLIAAMDSARRLRSKRQTCHAQQDCKFRHFSKDGLTGFAETNISMMLEGSNR